MAEEAGNSTAEGFSTGILRAPPSVGPRHSDHGANWLDGWRRHREGVMRQRRGRKGERQKGRPRASGRRVHALGGGRRLCSRGCWRRDVGGPDPRRGSDGGYASVHEVNVRSRPLVGRRGERGW
ncbi:extensin-like [Iris pallida]|uniref:Extensin-like n=1 Tax=Iris pallida TaxID=29817 RepID=A0AAX6F3J5_IRIPA|nr:extensin-like [Iris pallida]